MKKGIISVLLQYYQGAPVFHDDMVRAREEFFGNRNYSLNDCTDEERSWFFEWLVYDFLLSSDMPPVQDFFQRNPLNLPDFELQHYRDIANNEYGLYEILSIDLGCGMRIRNVHTGMTFDIRERKTTFEVKVGYLIFARVGRFSDHNELIGANGLYLPFKLGAELRKAWRSEDIRLTPKFQYDLAKGNTERDRYYSVKDLAERSGVRPDPKAANRSMSIFLQKHDMDSFVTTDKIKEWIYQLKRSSDSTPVTLLCGLLTVPGRTASSEDLNELLKCYNDLYNTSPHKSLRGKSPSEKVDENPYRRADIRVESSKISINEWCAHSDVALHAMGEGDMKTALRENNLCFILMFKGRTTFREVYRIYANKAIQHFVLGDREGGEQLLQFALELNPKYDFGIVQKQKYESGKFESMIPRKSSIRRKSFISDPAYRYYQFLSAYGINFATPSLTTSKSFNIS
ncbi:hypothetical protein HYW94_00420 [Candidatus Uhrbacteria bacterium]|nr:hypothetical protein [Candidatus Uhrbacteria bacterium]